MLDEEIGEGDRDRVEVIVQRLHQLDRLGERHAERMQLGAVRAQRGGEHDEGAVVLEPEEPGRQGPLDQLRRHLIAPGLDGVDRRLDRRRLLDQALQQRAGERAQLAGRDPLAPGHQPLDRRQADPLYPQVADHLELGDVLGAVDAGRPRRSGAGSRPCVW